ncbi:MAG: iron-sulfur cluster assembly accessory protein [Cellvibrionaceae bacterium]
MTVATYDPTAPAVTITDAALKHFEKKLSAADPTKKILRLSTEDSGCTGYAYVLDMVEAAKEDDNVYNPSEKITLAIASNAIDILRGTEIDLVTEGVNRVVKFNNPNVVSECGCGESFSVN